MNLYSIREAATILKVSRRRVYQLIDEGRLRTFRAEGLWHLVREDDLLEFGERPRLPGRPSSQRKIEGEPPRK